MNFIDRVVWITGASSGIGKALALELSKRQAKLILSSRNIEKLKQVKQQCEFPEKVEILPLDLIDFDAMDSYVKKALNTFGDIDILINNGGISQRSFAVETAFKVDRQILAVNYLGTVALTKALLPYFITKKNGHIVVVSSVVGKIGTPKRTSYSASKHALHGFFDSLRAEVYNDNIDITLICPGYVRTDISRNALMGDGTPQNKMDKATDNGLSPEYFVQKMVKAIALKKREVVISGSKEKLAVFVKRFFPGLFSKIIQKAAVT